MKKAINKIAIYSLLVTSILGVTACSGKSKNEATSKDLPDVSERYTLDDETPAWKLDKKEEITKLTWYVNADWWNTEFGKDMITKKVKEDLNVEIEFITGDDTKLNTYFAGGDMPDIVSIFDPNSSVARKAESWAIPLKTLANKYDPYFNSVAREDTLKWYELEDGNAYGYPDYSNTQEDYDSGDIRTRDAFIIRKDVYEAIGEPDMTTPDGFVSAMNTIKEKYPDLIPFGFNDFAADGTSNGSLDKVVQDMLGVPYTVDGKYYDRNLDEDYITWVKAFRKVHEDGNISDDSFTDDGDKFKEKVQTGKYATIMMGSFVNNGIPLQTFLTSNPDAAYIAVDGIQSVNNNEPTLTQAGISGWMINYISKQCSDPAKAIQIFTYLLSDEGGMLNSYGIENVTYTISDDGVVSWTEEAQKIRTEEPQRWQKEYRVGEFLQFGHDRYKVLNPDSDNEAIRQMQRWGEGKLTSQFLTENIYPDSGTQEARANSAITTNWGTTLVAMIRAKNDKELEGLLSSYKDFQESNNIKDIVAMKNKKIEANSKKLSN